MTRTNAKTVRWFFTFATMVVCMISCSFHILAADGESAGEGEDSSAGLPEQYAKNYLIARSTISPDKAIWSFASKP
jgi:hypothetical protein